MKCEANTQKYNSITQEDRVYTFLGGLDDQLDKIRGDVLQMQSCPTMNQAYALVHKEDLWRTVMLTKGDGGDTTFCVVMITKREQKSQQQPSFHFLHNGKSNTLINLKSQGEGRGCTHYRNMKHTKDTYFKLHRYPEWWHELKAKKKCEVGVGDNNDWVAFMNTKSQLSIIPQGNFSSLAIISQDNTFVAITNKSMALNDSGNHDWIIDSRATNHMTFDPHDFVNITQPKRTCVTNANGVTYPITGVGKVALSLSFTLSNTLLVPSLSNMYFSQESSYILSKKFEKMWETICINSFRCLGVDSYFNFFKS